MFMSTCLSSFYPYNTFCSWRAMSLVQAQEENSDYPVLRLLKQISVFWNEFADVSAHNQLCFERIFIRNISQPAEEITRSLKHKKNMFSDDWRDFFQLVETSSGTWTLEVLSSGDFRALRLEEKLKSCGDRKNNKRQPRPQWLHEHIFIAIALSKAKKF